MTLAWGAEVFTAIWAALVALLAVEAIEPHIGVLIVIAGNALTTWIVLPRPDARAEDYSDDELDAYRRARKAIIATNIRRVLLWLVLLVTTVLVLSNLLGFPGAGSAFSIAYCAAIGHETLTMAGRAEEALTNPIGAVRKMFSRAREEEVA